MTDGLLVADFFSVNYITAIHTFWRFSLTQLDADPEHTLLRMLQRKWPFQA